MPHAIEAMQSECHRKAITSQDCPYVPFKVLKTEEAQSRISVVRNMTAFEKADLIAGVPRYSHPGWGR